MDAVSFRCAFGILDCSIRSLFGNNVFVWHRPLYFLSLSLISRDIRTDNHKYTSPCRYFGTTRRVLLGAYIPQGQTLYKFRMILCARWRSYSQHGIYAKLRGVCLYPPKYVCASYMCYRHTRWALVCECGQRTRGAPQAKIEARACA